MRCIGLLVQSIDFNEVKNLLRHIFAIALFEVKDPQYITSIDELLEAVKGVNAACESSIDTVDIKLDDSQNFDDSDDPNNPMICEDEDNENVDIFEEIQNIYIEIEKSSQDLVDGEVNAFYCPAIANKLLNLCKDIVIWSGIMNPIFGYGKKTHTSAYSESVFNDIKNRVFQHLHLPTRLDTFVSTHITSNIGDMILVKAKSAHADFVDPDNEPMNKDHLEKCRTEPQHFDVACEPRSFQTESEFAEENWRGQGSRPDSQKPIKKMTYLHRDPTVQLVNLSSKSKCKVIGILKNGSTIGLKPITIKSDVDEEKNISSDTDISGDDGEQNSPVTTDRCVFINTCPFDSVVHAFCIAYAHSDPYSDYVHRMKNKILFFELIEGLIQNGVTATAYRKRAFILQVIFSSKSIHQNNVRIFPCQTTVSYLTSNYLHVFNLHPSVIYERECTCGEKHELRSPSIVVNLPSNSAELLESSLKDSLNVGCRKCDVCKNGNLVITSTRLGAHLILNVHTPDKNTDFDLSTSLQQIPIYITVQQNVYTLRGLVSFIAPKTRSKTSMGHYVTYGRRETGWEVLDDLQPSSAKRASPKSRLDRIQILLYTL